jgi:pyruvate kinase
MLIATLPAVHEEELLRRIIAHPAIGGVRYNVGVASAFSPLNTLRQIQALTSHYGKKLWIDLKGRQLRIVRWAAPRYGEIVLNHSLEVDVPATVIFRGNERSTIKVVKDRTIYIDPPPVHAVGQGQAINVHGDNLVIHGYLTDDDKDYIRAGVELGIYDFMLSFVESREDINEVQQFLFSCKDMDEDKMAKVEFGLKIETNKGLDFVQSNPALPSRSFLVVARDDFFTNVGENKFQMIKAIRQMQAFDAEVVLASLIFQGLELQGSLTMGDISDLYLMQQMGFQHFMLSDGLCGRHFDQAMQAWNQFMSVGSWK